MSDELTPTPSAIADELAPLQRQFVQLLLRLGNHREPRLMELLQQLCVATASGHACIELGEGVADPAAVADLLYDSGIVGRPGEFRPLVLDGAGRLYTYRYWRHEQSLAADLLQRAATLRNDVDPAALRPRLLRLFPDEHDAMARVAAAIAMLRHLCILSGGPGTGKTTTIVRLLAMLVEWHSPRPLRIALAAPTGKAAARMQEAVRNVRTRLPVSDAVIDAIPARAQTLHRLLGARPGGGRFAYDRLHPLPLDVLVVDEASMVDLALMSRVADALPPLSRLILVGDRDQLASVEPGAVLGSLCPVRSAYTPRFAAMLGAATGCDVETRDTAEDPMHDACALLVRSHRFAAGGAIAGLAAAIRDGRQDDALSQLAAGGDVQWHDRLLPVSELIEQLTAPLSRYVQAIRQQDVVEAFAAFDAFRVLSAVRDGPVGARWLNAMIEQALRRRLRDAGVAMGAGDWFAGRAVMINRNQDGLGLFNGDIVLLIAGANGLQAWRRGEGGDMRALAPARLPSHEPAYAMTVHKSQGSEFDEVFVTLPGADSPVLTRELLYTALTRARRRLVLWASEAAVRAAVGRPTRRGSGLRDACGLA